MPITGGELEHISNQKTVTVQHTIIVVIVQHHITHVTVQHIPIHHHTIQNMFVQIELQMVTADLTTRIKQLLGTLLHILVVHVLHIAVVPVLDNLVKHVTHNI